MTNASLQLPPAFLREAFSKRSGVPLAHFELYYRGKRLEGEATLASLGIGKDATIEVKMRGRGGMWQKTENGWKRAAPAVPTAVQLERTEAVAPNLTVPKEPQVPKQQFPSPSKGHVEKKLRSALEAGVEVVSREAKAEKEVTTAPRTTVVVIELHGGLILKPAQASIARHPTRPIHRSCSNS